MHEVRGWAADAAMRFAVMLSKKHGAVHCCGEMLIREWAKGRHR